MTIKSQNNLCTTLTEKWKKGELEFGAYYVNRLEEHRIWLYNDRSKTPESQHEIYEILAPVPSYDEWQRIFHYASQYEHEYTSCVMDYENLKQENQQLKELLLACQAYFNNQPNDNWAKSIVMNIDNAIGGK